MKTLATLFLTLIAAASLHAQGSVEAITGFDSPSSGGNDGTIGYTFRATAPINVTDLGAFAYIVDASSPMRVGLWDASGNLLAQALVTAGATRVGTSYYQPLPTPVALAAQQVYHIGAFYTNAPNVYSFNIVGGSFGGSVLTSPGIELIGFASNTNGFAFPASAQGGEGLFAMTGNFRYPGVPEPAVLSLALLGGLVFLLRRK